jgi:DNA-binding NarL/FixJ family response regulator
MIRVLVVDDHPIVRRGTAGMIADDPGLVVVGQGSDGQEALQLVAELAPDVLVIDVSMPHLDGVQATRQLRERGERLGILMLSAGGEDEQILEALKAGANGYLLKHAPDELLLESIKRIARGEPAVMQPEVTRVLLQGVTAPRTTPPASLVEPLSDREMEVLRQVAQDRENKEVARILGISDRTVQQHLANIYGKLQVNSRTGAVLKALRLGWITLEECAT